jgi:hypothetical protein
VQTGRRRFFAAIVALTAPLALTVLTKPEVVAKKKGKKHGKRKNKRKGENGGAGNRTQTRPCCWS